MWARKIPLWCVEVLLLIWRFGVLIFFCMLPLPRSLDVIIAKGVH